MSYANEDAVQVSEILDAVGTKIPVMITNILKTVYSEEAGRNVGRAVGTLYQELMNSGIPKETALKMATDYMISFKDLLGSLDLGKDRTRSPGAPTPGTTEDEA